MAKKNAHFRGGGWGVTTPNSTYCNVCSWEENGKRVMHLTFRDLLQRKHVSLSFTPTCPGYALSPHDFRHPECVKNTSVHKLVGFKSNVHSHTPREYCSKPMHQLCKLRFVLMMQAELPVKWNAFQTQKYTCARSSLNTKDAHWF